MRNMFGGRLLGSFLIGLVLLMPCCMRRAHEPLVAKTLHEAGDNATEFEKLLTHYDDGIGHLAAEQIIAGILGRGGRAGRGMDSIEALYRELPHNGSWAFDSLQLDLGRRYAALPLKFTKDVDVLTFEYLSSNIDEALRLRGSRVWNRGIPDEIFAEMLLPYRVGDEPLTSWRKAYRDWLADLEDTLDQCGSSVIAARIVAERIGPCPYNDMLSTPHRSALDLLEAPVGYCREDCDRAYYAMSSMGVPVAIDRMLVSPENGGSHSWMVVWDNIDERIRMFDMQQYLPTRDSLHYDHRRKGKVYRSAFVPDIERLARYRNAANPPAMLLNARMTDVTAEYFGHNKAEVEVWSELGVSEENAVYLGVFGNQRFHPVDIADLQGRHAIFRNIEPDLIYAPILGDGTVCGYPFMLCSGNGEIHSFVPDETKLESMTLTRKYPIRDMLNFRISSVIGLHVQSAPTEKGPWTDLEVLESKPSCIYHRIDTTKPLTGRYLRLFKPGGQQALIGMLLVCRDTLGLDRLPLSVVGDELVRSRYERIVKEDLSFGLQPGVEDCVVHIDSSDDVAAIFLVPPSDDNFVMPKQEYELLFFAGRDGWKSAGRKTSKGFSIDFEAPAGALLWLRNLTKGCEEQIFIWRDGRQMYNIDLYRPLVKRE